jgi:tetratricopeptide (TPR) repeat protein
MDQQQLAEKIDQLIGNAEVEKALDTLIEFLDSHPKFRNLEKAALNARSTYKRTRDKELKGTISSENASVQFSIIQNTILDLADKIKRGDVSAPATAQPAASGRSSMRWVLPLLLIILLAGGGYWYFSNRTGGGGGNKPQDACPEFSPASDLNVLLLPFQNLSSGELRPEIAIKDRLSTKYREYEVPSDVAIFEQFYELPKAEFPDFDDASRVAQTCDAKLIVWGTVERLPSERIDLNSKFKYLGPTEGFELDKIQVEGEIQVDTLESVSSIARQGSVTKDIEKLVLMIFGIVAHEQKNYVAAAEALEQSMDRNDTSGLVLRNMLLADSYLKMKKTNEAVKLYDEVLEINPNLELARNNRATLQYDLGNYREAIQDFSQILQKNPDDEDALAGRGAAYLQLKETQNAERDIDRLREINPRRKIIDSDKLKDLQLNPNLETKVVPQATITTINPNVATLLTQPQLFPAGNHFVPLTNNNKIRVPEDLQKGQTLIFAGRMTDGNKRGAHQILIPQKGTYRIEFKTKDGSTLSHQLLGSDGKTFFRNTEKDQSLILPRDKYNLQVHRKDPAGIFYYEVRITLEQQ